MQDCGFKKDNKWFRYRAAAIIVEASFMDVFAAVRGKMAQGLPMTTAKEELMLDFIQEWAEVFGYVSL